MQCNIIVTHPHYKKVSYLLQSFIEVLFLEQRYYFIIWRDILLAVSTYTNTLFLRIESINIFTLTLTYLH